MQWERGRRLLRGIVNGRSIDRLSVCRAGLLIEPFETMLLRSIPVRRTMAYSNDLSGLDLTGVLVSDAVAAHFTLTGQIEITNGELTPR